jgi:hypothetical protein
MRLINTHTLELEEFVGRTPPYAILSHTWGSDEVTLQDWLKWQPIQVASYGKTLSEQGSDAEDVGDKSSASLAGRLLEADAEIMPPGSGYWKIVTACRQALDDGLSYLWVDTNCIDKMSSAELSEAINSMYTWYRRSTVCYAYLADVKTPSVGEA